MKVKTSITLSKEVLKGIDHMAGSRKSRSAFIESALEQYLKDKVRAQIEARDLEALNRAADELVPEIDEVLRDQDELGDI